MPVIRKPAVTLSERKVLDENIGLLVDLHEFQGKIPETEMV
jgi:hypothetical protein